ncbi:MAG TPA: hypothetical protein VFB59_05015 [Candidatus Saccharimonadales bacterium]|nr:hypothetical protein [Candidatus Saccharimonadales bacterium]
MGVHMVLARLAKRKWLLFLGIAFVWQLTLSIAGYLASGGQLLAHTMFWDGGWYEAILKGGYFNNPSAPVFYPLFPLLIWILQQATFHLLSLATLGIVINICALWLALVALYKIGRKIVTGHEWLVVLLFLMAPAAFFMHMFYTEAVFCAIAFWAYWFALERKWLPMAALLALLTATRLPSMLIVGLCALEYLRAHQWSVTNTFKDKTTLLFLLAPLGLIAYGLFLYVVRGDFLYMFHAYASEQLWMYQSFNPNIIATIYQAGIESIRIVTGHEGQIVNTLFPLFSLAVLVTASIYAIIVARQKQSEVLLPLGLFGLAAMVLFTLNNNIVSVHRYVLPCLVVFVAIAHMYAKKAWARPFVWAFIALCATQQIVLFLLFTARRFAG